MCSKAAKRVQRRMRARRSSIGTGGSGTNWARCFAGASHDEDRLRAWRTPEQFFLIKFRAPGVKIHNDLRPQGRHCRCPDHGHRRSDSFEFPQQVHAAHAWQHDVEQDKIGALPPHYRKRLSRIHRYFHGVDVVERIAEHLNGPLVVVNDQDAAHVPPDRSRRGLIDAEA
jgi:hypothetical protein